MPDRPPRRRLHHRDDVDRPEGSPRHREDDQAQDVAFSLLRNGDDGLHRPQYGTCESGGSDEAVDDFVYLFV